ncbi:OmpP1/FadL family transporter [Robertkochia aurantiaca]|uniref:OmpP1/FadL family transporter n=1 Tax=Robertkochia aurantiaca TaxID=2873700 RepID=UPI001CCA49D5|nr:outer membrane protein transport protein [Robertkochia sp. 3YJGBD-33]
MRIVLPFLSIIATVITVSAQTKSDVLSLGLDNLAGTARYQGMSGAFGALGGDLSALNNNPASSAVFNNTSFAITGGNYNVENDTRYGNSANTLGLDQFELNQLGSVIVFRNTQANSVWRKVTLGFNYELQNHFDNQYLVDGNSSNSIADYFTAYAEGFTTDQIGRLSGESYTDAYINIGRDLGYDAQQGFLGYESFIIDPESAGSTSYISNGSTIDDYSHLQFVSQSGYDNKFTVNLGTQYGQNLYFGTSLNFHTVERRIFKEFEEDGYTPTSFLQFAAFDNYLYTYGTGFSFDFGMIGKINQMLRFGLSYRSPTWYRLYDELEQGVFTRLNTGSGAGEQVSIYPAAIFRFPDYEIQLPSKYTGSLALVFGEVGLISFDYTYQDMSNAELQPLNDPFFARENQDIRNQFQAVSTFKLGGEVRFERIVSLRAGYRFEQSPYKDGFTVGDLEGYSAGIGLNFGRTRIDMGYGHTEREFNIPLYDVGLTDTSNIQRSTNNLLFTFNYTLF